MLVALPEHSRSRLREIKLAAYLLPFSLAHWTSTLLAFQLLGVELPLPQGL